MTNLFDLTGRTTTVTGSARHGPRYWSRCRRRPRAAWPQWGWHHPSHHRPLVSVLAMLV